MPQRPNIRKCRKTQGWGWGGANRRRRVELGVLLMKDPYIDLILEMVLEKLTCQDRGRGAPAAGDDMMGPGHMQGAGRGLRGVLAVGPS